MKLCEVFVGYELGVADMIMIMKWAVGSGQWSERKRKQEAVAKGRKRWE